MSASSEGSIAQATDKNLNVKNKLELTAANDITLDNVGNLVKATQINDGDNVKLNRVFKDGLILDGLKAKGDVDITSEITLKAAGNIDIEGEIMAGNKITVNSARLDVFGAGNMTAGDDINLTVNNGDIKIRNSETSIGYVTSVAGNIKMTVKTGDINIGGELLAQDGKIDLKMTGEGNTKIGSNASDTDTITSNGNITLKTEKGNIDISGSTIANKGDVAMTIASGNVGIKYWL